MSWIRSFGCLVFVALSCILSQLSSETCAAEPASDANSGEIAVRAINGTGVPQADAVVSLFRYDSVSSSYITTPRDAKSDSSGIVRFTRLAAENSYIVQAKTPDGLVGYRQCDLLNKTVRQDVDLTVLKPVAATIHVHDGLGNAVPGASIRLMKHSGPNGTVWLWLESRPLVSACGCSPNSDAAGNLVLPELPDGKVDIALKHPDFAPTKLSGITLDRNIPADATLKHGIKLTFQIKIDANAPPTKGLLIDITHESNDNPSSFTDQLPELRPDGTAQLTVAAGKYISVRLRHPDYFVTPEYLQLAGHGLADDRESFEIGPGADQFTFQLHRKVKARGRVLDGASGKPISGSTLLGDLHSDENNGPFARFALEWGQAGFAETNDRGEFEIDLAAGLASISIAGGHYVSPTRYRIGVAADGSIVPHDILVRSPPKVRGIVQDQGGTPLTGAIVRFRGSVLNNACSSAVTDAQGRFELSPPFVPVDWKTEEPQPLQTLVAFHPYEPLGAEVRIRLEESTALDHVVLRMKLQDYSTQVTGYPEELSPFQRGIIPPDQKEHLAAISLVGKPAPELDGAAWLNTDKPKMSLADFRGKFVLLQFWTTWCGVCHWDMPRVKLVRDLYKDKGLVVIGVHDNSMPLDAIKEDVAKNGLKYPIVVDRPDGRILASYEGRGFNGFPSFILIGPDGKVIKDDETVASPWLFSFKTEIIRQFIMTRRQEDH
ncbi:MAG TPA: redoxin family protein [Pirellulales bacterium]|nr:redoxin family protein [Pirellulales bacterium]